MVYMGYEGLSHSDVFEYWRAKAAQGTAAAALSWAVETMGLAMGCSMGRGRSANPKRSRALARANMRMLGGARRKR